LREKEGKDNAVRCVRAKKSGERQKRGSADGRGQEDHVDWEIREPTVSQQADQKTGKQGEVKAGREAKKSGGKPTERKVGIKSGTRVDCGLI